MAMSRQRVRRLSPSRSASSNSSSKQGMNNGPLLGSKLDSLAAKLRKDRVVQVSHVFDVNDRNLSASSPMNAALAPYGFKEFSFWTEFEAFSMEFPNHSWNLG